MAVLRLRCGIARRRRQLTRREGEVVREEAVRIAAPQGPADVSVDVSDAPNAPTRTCLGGADRSAQRSHAQILLDVVADVDERADRDSGLWLPPRQCVKS